LDDAGAFMSDQTDLKNAIGQCESCLEPLLDDVQAGLNNAIAAGQADLAQTLLSQFRQLSFAIGAISDQKIAQIDSSAEMQKAIAGFQGVNKSVTAQLNQLKSLQTFVNTLNSILGPLNTAIGIAFKKSSTGAAQSAATSPAASGTPSTGTTPGSLTLSEVVPDQTSSLTNISSVRSEFLQTAPPRPRAPQARTGLAGIILLAVIFAINVRWAGDMLVTIWLLTTLAVALSVALFGVAGGRLEATFIDNRNRMSLSKLQTILWTVVIFSALLSASCFNASLPNAASAIAGIVVDPKLWALLGITMTTAVGAPLALSGKTTRSPSLLELTDTRKNLLTFTGVSPANIGADGHVLVKADQQDARWNDAVLGDDVGNADTMDFSKIQQLYFTLLTILVFLLAIAKTFGDAATNHSVINQLPVPDAGFLGLLGVSGAGYLAYKSISHSKDAS